MAKRASKIQQEEAKVKYFKPQDILISLEKIQKPIINKFISNQITVLTGDAGTGKTTLAMYYAVKQLLAGEFESIIISKNPVESGASIGFLKGDLEEKLTPYKDSYIEVLVKLVGKLKATELLRSNKIKFEALGFVRGKTFENSCIILDEFQNLPLHDLMSFVTRKHSTSKLILLGDDIQTDIKNSGFFAFTEHIIKNIPLTEHVVLGDEFQMRDALIVALCKNYKEYLKKNKK